jgi:hypothetical protein
MLLDTLVLYALGTGAYEYMGDAHMKKPAARKNGKILVDLHVHLTKKCKEHELLEVLSQGVTGIAALNGKGYVRYEDVLELPGVKEIDKGLFAEVNYRGNTGYALKVQEVKAYHHILAVGIKDYLGRYGTPEQAAKAIKEQGGLSVFSHPGLIDSKGGILGWYIDEDEKGLAKVCKQVDAIEQFNAFCNSFPPIINFRKINKMAKQLAEKYGFIGIAVSDTHYRLDQPRTSGIYIDEKYLSAKGIKQAILTRDFKRVEKYISRASMIKGMLFEK